MILARQIHPTHEIRKIKLLAKIKSMYSTHNL